MYAFLFLFVLIVVIVRTPKTSPPDFHRCWHDSPGPHQIQLLTTGDSSEVWRCLASVVASAATFFGPCPAAANPLGCLGRGSPPFQNNHCTRIGCCQERTQNNYQLLLVATATNCGTSSSSFSSSSSSSSSPFVDILAQAGTLKRHCSRNVLVFAVPVPRKAPGAKACSEGRTVRRPRGVAAIPRRSRLGRAGCPTSSAWRRQVFIGRNISQN